MVIPEAPIHTVPKSLALACSGTQEVTVFGGLRAVEAKQGPCSHPLRANTSQEPFPNKVVSVAPG